MNEKTLGWAAQLKTTMKKESSPTPVFTAPESEPPVYNTAPMEDPDERQQQYTISTKPKRMSTWDAWKLALRVMDVVFTVVNLMLIGVLVGLGDWSSGIVVILVAFPAVSIPGYPSDIAKY